MEIQQQTFTINLNLHGTNVTKSCCYFGILSTFLQSRPSPLIIDRIAPQAARRCPDRSPRVSHQVRATAAESPRRGEMLVSYTITQLVKRVSVN